jgi:hypothetical protein
MRKTLLCLVVVLFCVSFALAQSSQIKKQLVEQMISNGDIRKSCVKEQGGVLKAVNIQLEYLDNDKQPEYVVSGDGSCCVGARRCANWIYQKTANGYRKIYGGADGDQADLEFLKTKTKGYRNIRSTTYSGNEAFTAIFKFNGSHYQ